MVYLAFAILAAGVAITASFPAFEYIPVAVIARLPDGQIVVLHGQAEQTVTDIDIDYDTDRTTTTVTWRRDITQLRMPDSLGVVVPAVLNGSDGPRFEPAPLIPEEPTP